MHRPSILTIGLIASVATGQSPLVVSPSGGGLYTWPGPQPVNQLFFDLTVNTQVTLRSLGSLVAVPAWTGALPPTNAEVSLWLTIPGVVTYVGSETTPGNWYEAASWVVTAGSTTGTSVPFGCETCLKTRAGGALVLPAGSYGCAVRTKNMQGLFYAVPSLPNSFATAELSLTGGALQNSAFNSAPSAPPTGFAGWSWIGQISYANGAVPNGCASASPFGAGCNAATPLQLAASNPPQRGTTIKLVTSNQQSAGFGITLFSPYAYVPGYELSFLGAPGCLQHVSGPSITISNLGLPGLGMSVPLSIPNLPLLLGVEFFAQSAWLDPAANPAGLVTSNGLQLVVD